jgi:hypothetical protein
MLYDLLVILVVKQGDPKGQAIIKLREIYKGEAEIERMAIMQMLQNPGVDYQIGILKKVFGDSELLKMVEDNLRKDQDVKELVKILLDGDTDARLKKLYG